MKKGYGFGIILACLLLGQGLHLLIPVKIPGPIYGMAILFALLVLKVVKVEMVEEAADLLIRNMILFFVPGGVLLAKVWGLVAGNLLAIVLTLTISTLLTLVVVAKSCDGLIEKKEASRD